jgi:hypothetical protein
MIEQHEAAGFTNQIDLVRREPSDDLRSGTTRGVDQTSQIRVGERDSQIATAIAATGAAEPQVAEAARHGQSLPQFGGPRSGHAAGTPLRLAIRKNAGKIWWLR